MFTDDGKLSTEQRTPWVYSHCTGTKGLLYLRPRENNLSLVEAAEKAAHNPVLAPLLKAGEIEWAPVSSVAGAIASQEIVSTVKDQLTVATGWLLFDPFLGTATILPAN